MYIGEEEASIYMDVEEDSIYICIYIYIYPPGVPFVTCMCVL